MVWDCQINVQLYHWSIQLLVQDLYYFNYLMSNPKFDKIFDKVSAHLLPEQLMAFKVFCSSQGMALDKWIEISMTLYRTDPAQCLDFLTYVEKHELSRSTYRDISNHNAKIYIYNSLAGLHLSRATKQGTKQQIDKALQQTRRYINASEKVKMSAGRIYLTLRGFIYFYQGSFELSYGNFNKSIQSNPDDQQKSIVGILGLAQLNFAKRNYEVALNYYKKALSINKALPTKARLGMAYCFYELQKYEMAKACFKRIIDLDSQCIEALIGYATISYHQNIKDIYFSTLEKCYKINKNHPLVLLHLAEHFLLSKNKQKLITIVQKGLNEIKKFPTFTDKSELYRNDLNQYKSRFNHLLGMAYHQSNQYDQCLKYYTLSLNKNLVFPNINLAQAYINPSNPNFVEAIKLLQTTHKSIKQKHKKLISETFRALGYIKSKAAVKKQKDESINYYENAVRFNPRDYQSYIEFGNLMHDLDPRKAVSLYENAYRILEEQGEFVHPQLLNNIAVFKISEKQFDQAEKYLNLAFDQIEKWKDFSNEDDQLKIIKEKGFLITFNFNFAILYEETYKNQQALIYYNKVLELNPYYLDVYARLAFYYYKKGNIAEAFNKCQVGIKIAEQSTIPKHRGPKADKLYLMKAYIFKLIGDERNAKDLLRDITRDSYIWMFEQSLDYDIIIQRPDSNTRNLRENLKLKAQAVLKTCEQDHHNLYSYMLLSVLLSDLQKFRESSEGWNKIKQFDNQHPKILYNLGIHQFKSQDYESALVTLKKYIEKLGGHFQSEFATSIIYFIQGRFEEGIKHIKKLVLLRPGNVLLRYNLNLFIQRASEAHLDLKNKEISKTKKSIVYLQKLIVLYTYLTKLNVPEYLKCIQNPQLKQKYKEQLIRIRDKSEDQKLYIRSREDSFFTYQKQAMEIERKENQEKQRIRMKLREIQQRKNINQRIEDRKKQIEAAKKRQLIERQKALEEKLNQAYRQQLYQKNKDFQHKKVRTKSNKKSNKVDRQNDDYDPDDDKNLVEVKNEPIKKKRLLKKIKQFSQEQQPEEQAQQPRVKQQLFEESDQNVEKPAKNRILDDDSSEQIYEKPLKTEKRQKQVVEDQFEHKLLEDD